ncbi:cytoglobin-1 [Zerene cesonia]|uniref:cytoglobin-1 n=1 Tax=Zerene cesonia TaxID=33412 RepID=UPI0018E5713C|nr:cytoglobin-1 [Zerene cesonia]
MGTWFSHLLWGGDPDEVNPVSGLSKREIHAVQKSWTPVYANALATGTELLRRFFRAYPKTLEFFKMIRNVPEEEYANNIQFRAHVINLMSSLNQAVINLHQPEVVVVMMNKLGESHGRRRIQEYHFHDLKGVIVNMFIEVLKLDEATLGAWGKTVEFWYKHIFETLAKNETTS